MLKWLNRVFRGDFLSQAPVSPANGGRSSTASQLFHYEERPPFTIQTAEMMEFDPKVTLGLAIRNGLLKQADVKAVGVPKVAEFTLQQWRLLWDQFGSRLLRTKVYGFGGFEVIYQENAKGQIEISDLRDFRPQDIRPLVAQGRAVGLSVRGAGSAKVAIFQPKSIWLTHRARHGGYYGQSLLEHAYAPWWEKWQRGGCIKLRQMRMQKDAWIGDIIRYPTNRKLILPTGEEVTYRDLARQIVELRASGGSMGIPSDRDQNGNELFGYQPPQHIDGATMIFDYSDRLNDEICEGLEVPKEVIAAAETGSGFSGRSIPFIALLSVLQEEFDEIVAAVTKQVLVPLVRINFGAEASVKISPKSLLETVGAAMGGTGEDSGSGPQQSMGGVPGGFSGGPVPNQGGSPSRYSALSEGRWSPSRARVGGGGAATDEVDRLAPRKAPACGAVAAGVYFAPGEWIDQSVVQMSSDEELAAIQLAVAHAPSGGISIGGEEFTGGEFIPSSAMKKATAKEKSQLEKKTAKATTAKATTAKATTAKAAESKTQKRAAPGSQMEESHRTKMRELGMVGTFPPADVPTENIKFADLSKSKDDLKFVALMSWDQKTASGRVSRQYRYTQEFHDRNAEEKFERVKVIEPHLEKIKSGLKSIMTNGALSTKDREAAAIASAIAETGLRPTDGDDSIKHGHYGISSLLGKHAKIVGDEIHLDFIGKEGVRNQTIIRDPVNVSFLKSALKSTKPDEFIFKAANSGDAGNTLKTISLSVGGPKDIKVKDLRTLKATQTARRVVDEYEGPPPPLTGNVKKDAKAIAKAILDMSGKVSSVLNNTPTQARDNYIHPEIFRTWQAKLQAAS